MISKFPMKNLHQNSQKARKNKPLFFGEKKHLDGLPAAIAPRCLRLRMPCGSSQVGDFGRRLHLFPMINVY